MSTAAGSEITKCRWCGNFHGVQCPSVKAIEFFADGTVKRVEFKGAADYSLPTPTYIPLPYYVPQLPTLPNWIPHSPIWVATCGSTGVNDLATSTMMDLGPN